MDKAIAETAAEPLELPVALGGELLIEILNLKLRIKCALVGMEAGQYLIIKIPPKDLIGNFQSETVKTSKMIVRFLHRD
ncbi:MAG: hypothetical protein HZB21_01825, partial [Deltaproteobacteria bacterium]|nr:hypothetical protein [Deltaproteobacteria bacterium]